MNINYIKKWIKHNWRAFAFVVALSLIGAIFGHAFCGFLIAFSMIVTSTVLND
jgi:hypothetical protein